MVNRPSVPEIITVNSETLQTQIRDLLPSQNGFGSELQASNVITPIIDLTSAAEGSGLPFSLQTALAFGSQTSFSVSNSNTTILSSTGFFRIYGQFGVFDTSSGNGDIAIEMTDGSSTKIIWRFLVTNNQSDYVSQLVDLMVFLSAGDSVSINSSSANTRGIGSTRQIATGDGTLVNPSGYPL